MQKTKRIILTLLKKHSSDRFQIRQHFADTSKATNSDTLIMHLTSLQNTGCVVNNNGFYSITSKGKELEDLLTKVDKLIK